MKRSLQTYAVSIQKGFRQLGMELVAREPVGNLYVHACIAQSQVETSTGPITIHFAVLGIKGDWVYLRKVGF